MTEPRRPQHYALLLALCALALLAAGWYSHDRIAHARQQIALNELAGVLPPERYDNDPLQDRILLSDPALGTTQPLPLLRARRGGVPSAVVVQAQAQGYAGPFLLRIGIARDGHVLGVRVLSQQETPGLGDVFARDGGAWLGRFDERSLADPAADGWRLRRDGGQFDQLTGATVTPRAIVQRLHAVLEAQARDGEHWFTRPAQP
jgi:electron transport complex protein RnfG